MYTHTCIHRHTNTHTYTYIYKHTNKHIHSYVCTYVNITTKLTFGKGDILSSNHRKT